MGFTCKRQTKHRQLVGDPIDVVTGANIDITCDFELPGPIPLFWNRYYHSGQNNWRRALGWGHTHEYDRRLVFDVDGLHYVDPSGDLVAFDPLDEDGAKKSAQGFILIRIDRLTYCLQRGGSECMEFRLTAPGQGGVLSRLISQSYTVEFHYSDKRYLERIIDSLGRTVRVESDELGCVRNLVLLQEAESKTDRELVSYDYDENGNLIKGVDPYGHTFAFEYDQDNRIVARTDRRGYSVIFSYDSRGRCTHSGGADGLHEVRLTYEPPARTTSVARTDGGTWFYEYDTDGAVTRIVDPYGGKQTYRLDDQGRVTEEFGPGTKVVRTTYNYAGEPIRRNDGLGRSLPLEEEPEAPEIPGSQPLVSWLKKISQKLRRNVNTPTQLSGTMALCQPQIA